MKKEIFQLSDLVEMNSPLAVLEEVKNNYINFYEFRNFLAVKGAFKNFIKLFDGMYPGYRGCNTKFHNKKHTTDALLAISRMIDGYNIEAKKILDVNKVNIALIATIFHDSGYIQKNGDITGTGAKYTLEHIKRSNEFLVKYLINRGFSKSQLIAATNMVNCTGLNLDISKIKFQDKQEQTLGYMLGTADLLGQMSSRTYLEGLIYLYKEFKEGNVPGYKSELDLFNKTISFYELVKKRLKDEFINVKKYILIHLKKRYNISEDLYEKSINNQINYLKCILKKNPKKFRKYLRRRYELNSFY